MKFCKDCIYLNGDMCDKLNMELFSYEKDWFYCRYLKEEEE